MSSPDTYSAAAWDGTGWRLVAPPPVEPRIAFACASPTWCVVFEAEAHAVWDGTSWTRGTHPRFWPGDVSCPAPSLCFAASVDAAIGRPSFFRWEGSAWSAVAGSESIAKPRTVACAAVDRCVIITGLGSQPSTIVRWADGGFTTLPIEGPAITASAVDCPATDRCVMSGWVPVDGYNHLAVATWSGGAVETTPLTAAGAPVRGVFNYLDCTGPSQCLAAGYDGPSAVLDGAGWRVVTGTEKRGDVACATSAECFVSAPAGLQRWTGDSWRAVEQPAGAEQARTRAGFTDVSCATPAACVAVGTYDGAGRIRALAESWDGARWTLLPDLPLAGDADAGPPRVDCAAPTECVATVAVTRAGVTEPVLATWNGADWTVTATGLTPPAGTTAAVDDVACAVPAACMAVGRFIGAVGQPQPTFALTWDGDGWSSLPAPSSAPVGDTESIRSRLSCGRPRWCVRLVSGAVNFILLQYHNTLETWDGVAWRPAPRPFAGNVNTDTAAALDIACTAPDACVVGGHGSTTVPFTSLGPVAATWNGTRWAPTVLSPPPGVEPAFSAPVSLSCAAADRCLGLHDRSVKGGHGPAAQGWAGPRPAWSTTAAPALGPEVGARSVSCREEVCLVVGEARSGQSTVPVAYSYRFAA